MTKRQYQELIEFSKCLAGIYSNKEQSREDPRNYALINIYFIPLKWSFFKRPSFYSEQSYDYSPWSPYRQGIHLLKLDKGKILIENFKPMNQDRLAGSGFMPELLKEVETDKILRREGCNMHFYKINHGHYKGEIEPGCNCKVEWNGHMTYVSSKVELTGKNMLTLDEGFDPITRKKIWGSTHGILKFEKSSSLKGYIKEEWLGQQ